MTGTTFGDWLLMCSANDEFVANYNRLSGAKITFQTPYRTPFDKLIDAATGHVPMPKNDPNEMAAFFAFCADMLGRLWVPEPDAPAGDAA